MFGKGLICVLVPVFLCGAVFSQTKSHPCSVHDLLAAERISDLQVSPNGKKILFVRTSTDVEENRSRSDIWVIGSSGKGLRRLTSHPENDSNPRWMPDGKSVLFVSKRSDTSQIWRIPIDGGEAVQLSDLALDVSSLIVSPTGEHIAFAMEVFVDAESIEETKKRLDETEENKATGRLYDSLFVRHWNAWADGRRRHLFVMPIAGSTPVDVMADMDADCPSRPFGGAGEFTFTPDGKGVVFTARDAGRTEPWSTDFDLYHVSVDAFGPPRCLTRENKAWDTTPVFSPDGKTLAYLAMSRAGYESDRVEVVLRPWPDGERRVLTKDWDRSMPLWFGTSTMAFSRDGRTIYAGALDRGQRSLFAIDVKTGTARSLVKNGYAGSPVVTADGIAFAHNDYDSPVELYSVGGDGTQRKQLTRVNAEHFALVRLGDYEQFHFKGFNNERVYCHVVRPVDFDPDKKYPVVFQIHGGPQSSSVNRFGSVQLYAAAGFTVVLVDFHGSAGYGQAFTDSINADWGGKPLEDLKKGLAEALKRYPWMDGERVGAIGGSYGGYMINWIAGNWPDRFRCLVDFCGLFDVRSFYYATEELWFPEWDLNGTPWENPAVYARNNPALHVDKWKTPMLVIHGGQDFRVPYTQGLSTFTALQRRGIESRLLYFADEGHGIGKPHNRIQYYETVIDWFDKWLK